MSSVIEDASYDPTTAQLRVVFTSGKIYIYDDVPEETFANLVTASSMGRYFNARIRDVYSCREVATDV